MPPNYLTTGSGLVGYWTFDGKDTNWGTNKTNDLSGQGNTGTLTNMSTTTSPVVGKIGQGLKFDGVNDYIRTGNTTSFDNLFASGITICAWAKYQDFSTFQRTVTIENETNLIFDVWLQANQTTGIVQFGSGGSGAYKNSSTALTVNVWYHLCGATDYTSGGTKIYINGIDNGGTVNGTPTYTADKGSLDIGVLEEIGKNYGKGVYDDVRIYNRALSASEVLQLYNIGR